MSDDRASTPARPPDVEARLRALLARKAGGDPVTSADWGDLAGRLAASTRRRQRVLAAAAALALVVGAAGGYLGEAAASAGTVAARPGSGSAAHRAGASGGTAALAPSAAAPGVMCPDGSGTGTSGTGASSSDGIGSATRLFIRTTTDGVTIRAYQDAQSAVSSCSVTLPPPAGSGSGSGSGVNSSPGSTGSTGSAGSAGSAIMPLTPAAPDVTVELSDDDAVGQGAISAPVCVASPDQGSTGSTGSTGGAGSTGGTGAGARSGAAPVPPSEGLVSPPVDIPDPPATTTTTGGQSAASSQSEPRELASGTFGVLEGDPVWWVAVEVGTDVASVQMTFPDGASDQMGPVNGIAVLAHRVSTAVASLDPGPDVVRGSLQLLGSGGSVVATVTLPQEATPVPVPVPTPTPLNEAAPSVSPGVVGECPPPPTLTPKAQSSGVTENR